MSITLSKYGQEREINATPEELKIAEWIINEYPDDELRLVRLKRKFRGRFFAKKSKETGTMPGPVA